MIKGKILLEDGEVLEREFDSIWDFLKADYILMSKTRKSYEFYFDNINIERLGVSELFIPFETGGNHEPSFLEEFDYLAKEINDYIEYFGA